MSALPPLAVYVHIPWCVRKCPYCDFNSHEASSLPEAAYVAALLEDLEQDLALVQGRPIHSVFFGGGTPSLFQPASIGRILEGLRARLEFADAAEITLEANPGTTEHTDFRALRQTGVNRLSLGVQTFNDAQLERLGRIHRSREASHAFHAARTAGFANINIDLMHGLPEQTAAEAAADLRQAIALAPEHLSWYQLTVEPNTVFYSKPPPLPPEDTLYDINEQGLALLASAGYQRYEVSAFAQAGLHSRHNLNYWQFGDYLGLGAGAHGKLTSACGTITRRWKTRTPKDYLDPAKPFVAGQKPVTPDEQLLEFLLNGLRLVDGVPAVLLRARTSVTEAELARALAPLRARELITGDADTLCTTALGYRFLNTVLAALDG